MKHRLVIEVLGGIVQAVFTDHPERMDVIVVDWDREPGGVGTYGEEVQPMERMSTETCRELRTHLEETCPSTRST